MIDISRYYYIGKKGKQTFIVDMHTKHIVNKLNQYYQKGQMHHFLVKPLQAELENRNVKTELFMETKKISTEQISDMLSKPLMEERDLNIDEIDKAQKIVETLTERNKEIYRNLSILKDFQKGFSDKVLTFEQSKIIQAVEPPITLEEIFFPEDDDPNLPARHSEDFKTVPPPPYDYWERYLLLSKQIVKEKRLINKVKWAFKDDHIDNMAQALMKTEKELMSLKNYGKKAHANFTDYCKRKGYKVEEFVPYRQQITERLATEAELQENIN